MAHRQSARIDPKNHLREMFAGIVGGYDTINHVMAWGMDKGWRRRAAAACIAAGANRVLDLGCGTGDLTKDIIYLAGNETGVVGFDGSYPMLEIACQKTESRGGNKRVSFVCGDAANLPFSEGSFGCMGLSFTFRNLTFEHPLAERHLAELLRVLHPGGQCVILETSQPTSPLIRWFFHLYLRFFVAVVGRLLSGQQGAYHYLAESTSRFYTVAATRKLLITAGFRQVSYRPLFFGAAGIWVAVK